MLNIDTLEKRELMDLVAAYFDPAMESLSQRIESALEVRSADEKRIEEATELFDELLQKGLSGELSTRIKKWRNLW